MSLDLSSLIPKTTINSYYKVCALISSLQLSQTQDTDDDDDDSDDDCDDDDDSEDDDDISDDDLK